ncbi:tetratricopeptide repeat protein [Streptomyces ardesiacus]|uniref:tetratricopeptide repeat protein n=1 Tax=Streptomyces ardesiacus TaxID=285564 RepID=UPI0036DFC71B
MADQSRVRNHERRASPYSTGGGGTVLEHRYGALLLSHLLTGDPLSELGDDVTPDEVVFQASAFSAVDDLLLSGRSTGGDRRRVSIGVRRDPSFVPSDRSTVELMGSYLQVMRERGRQVAEGTWRLALVVASPNTHVRQLQELAGIARDTESSDQFRLEVSRAGRTHREVRERLRHLDAVVASAAAGAGIDTTDVSVAELTWRVLGALRLREVRFEGVEETDRAIAVGRLRGIVEAGTADAADRLFSRLCELVGRYAPAAATKSVDSLRRDLIGFPLAVSPSKGEGAHDVGDPAPHLPVVRSAYVSQVRRIAPERLRSREGELDELARFCTDSGPGPAYVWWRAEAWAGKSALLSTFVLDPPPGVRVLSFFVTARWAGQADSKAFTEVVLEQALELMGEPMPMLLTDATREAHLLGAFERAADLCRQRGERLVLVLDGLDEDRGVTTGPDAHSIAAILPADPPSGMRVIVAGRPRPPIPVDVPDDHPLRRPEIVRTLTASPHAEVVRQDAERELKRLLHGPTIEKDLLGLLAAAGGGLSEADLAQLTGVSEGEIESQLGAVSGRTFASRAGRWRSQVAIYVLGHEEIQRQALRFLGEARLNEYRERIHAWAEGFRAAKWPIGSPEYLLHGYFKLLHSTGDVPRMVACATDPYRHHRMLDTIGGDSVALAEIATVQEFLVRSPTPDLVALSRLAVHRAKLSRRNDHIPTYLPVVWAQLGRYSRAEALARSITTPARQVRALASVSRQIAAAGDVQRARKVAEEAERCVLAVTELGEQARAYAVIARSLARAGDRDRARLLVTRAEELTCSMTEGGQRSDVLGAVARAAVAGGDVERGLALAKSVPHASERAHALCVVAMEVADASDWRRAQDIARSAGPRSDWAPALAAVARAASAAGDRQVAADIAGQAVSLAMSIRNPSRRAWILAGVAHELAEAGMARRAKKVLRRAEESAHEVTRTSERCDRLITIARAMAFSGASDRAVALAGGFDTPRRRTKALAVVASGLAANGETRRAEELAAEAEARARAMNGRHHVGRDQAVLAQATASTGDLHQAEEIARAISDAPQRDRSLTVVAEAFALAGDLGRAEGVAASITDLAQRSTALLLIVRAGVTRDDRQRVGRVARSIEDTECRRRALAALSRGTRTAPRAHERSPQQHHPSVRPRNPTPPETGHSSGSSSSVTSHQRQADDLMSRARTAAQGGDMQGAREAVEAIASPALRVKALISLSTRAAAAGDTQTSEELIERAFTVADTLLDATSRDRHITMIARESALTGDLDRAERLINSITSPPLLHKALSAIASAATHAGHLAQAERLARTISDASPRAKALAAIARSMVGSDDLDEAERVARSITEPLQRSRTLGEIARSHAGRGDTARAAEIAADIPEPAERARTLTTVALDSDGDRAKALVAQALCVGHWSICLPALVRLVPEVVTTLGTESLRVHDQEDAAATADGPKEREGATTEPSPTSPRAGQAQSGDSLASSDWGSHQTRTISR